MKEDYQEAFLGKHDVVAINVQSGNLDAGGLNEFIYAGLIGAASWTRIGSLSSATPIRGPIIPGFTRTTCRPPCEKIRQALLELKDPAVLKPLKADGFQNRDR